MNELRLLFDRSAEGLKHRVVTSSGVDAGSAEPFEPFLSDDDYEDLRWYLEEYMDLPMGGSRTRAERVERAFAAWGRRLFDALFGSGDRREVYNDLIDGDAPRLLTIGSRDLEVLRLPWELMADARGPLTRRGVTIRRQLETAGRALAFDAGKLPLRILLAVSRPDGAGFLDPRHTTRAMLDALAPLGSGVVVDFCRPATLARLERMLTDAEKAGRPYHIVHFDGHGTFLPASQIGALLFEKDEDETGKIRTDAVRADRIGNLLAAHKIPLAILEACRSAALGHVAAFRGVAPALIDAGVGSVLSMSHAVHVEATKILLTRFYEELVGGGTIGQAMEQGRAGLMAAPDRWIERGPGGKSVALQDWFLPHLYQRGQDLTFVPVKAKKGVKTNKGVEVRKAPARGEEPGAFPPPPMYAFHGRAPELHLLERRFGKHPAVLLHAMGGMGKTSLAREAAYWWSKTGLFPDGAVFVSFEQAGGAERAIRALGAYFDGVAFEQKNAAEQRERARELFLEKKVLVVWDNFESVLPQFQEGEAVPLYPEEERREIHKIYEAWTREEKGNGRLLITCRPGETGLGAVCKAELEGLAPPDALSLLYRVMQVAEVPPGKYEREALERLLKVVDHHPLSIELVGPHLKQMGPESIEHDFRGLLDGFTGDAAEGRNRSLRASLEFSLRRLSPTAREAVKWLGLFQGGVFEQILLVMSEIEPAAWEALRGELETTALLRVERDAEMSGRPYLRFHPTLVHAAAKGEIAAEVRQRYVAVYLAVMTRVDEALSGSNPRGGMEVMLREEASFRRAVTWALEERAYSQASNLGDTLRKYLQMAGRLRERDRWVAWLATEVRKGGFSPAAAYREIDEAAALLRQGHPREATAKLEALIARLRATADFDATFLLAFACGELGRFYYRFGSSQKAIPILEDAIKQCEALVDKARAAGEMAETALENLAATLGDLANALRNVGRLEDAMMAAEQSRALHDELDSHREIAADDGRIAQILMLQGRHAEADARYDQAIEAARRAGDRELEGALLQHQGGLADDRGQYDRAAQLYQRALQLFHEMHDDDGVLNTCNLLGVVEGNAGRLAEARAWYERSYALARERHRQDAVAVAAQNLGIVCQSEGEAARKQGDEPRARERFAEAIRFIDESLTLKRENENAPGMANSHGQLARIHLLLGDLDAAEEHAGRAGDIHERLGLKEACRDYNTLADIARARGHAEEAAAWEQKRDTLLAELDRLAGAPALPDQLLKAITQLALTCAEAGLEGSSLDAEDTEALATIATWPPPLNTLPPFLRALAEGTRPAIPPALPPELTTLLTRVLEAIDAARASPPSSSP